MSQYPLRERRKRASRWFALRVCLLLALIGGVAYAAWFAPQARRPLPVQLEVKP